MSVASPHATKRKRPEDTESKTEKRGSSKKIRRTSVDGAAVEQPITLPESEKASNDGHNNPEKGEKPRKKDGKHSSDKRLGKKVASKSKSTSEEDPKLVASEAQESDDVGGKPLQKSTKKRKKQDAIDGEDGARHVAIFSKFRKAVKDGNEKVSEQPGSVPLEKPTKIRDLVPIPQPEPLAEVSALPSFSALPSWLAQPITVSPHAAKSFLELGVDTEVAQQLEGKGFKQALAVQTAVLPLLLPKSSQHPGDLCVSAATGSGKTLSYVLPMVQDLKTFSTTGLRAIIVVPTRELVTQVQDVARICTAGTSLKVGTAVGSHTLKAEQEMLVRKGRRYDPAGFQALSKQLERKMLWLNPESSEDEIPADEDHEPSNDDLGDAMNILPNHVPEYISRVDILICTPGRLVDHLHSTPGFSLKQVRWLIIDEADKLLDQSFQEWAGTLNKGLESISNANKSLYASSSFPYSFLDQQQERVRKVILSATMTRDLDKLGSLHLWNPRLVIVEGSHDSNLEKNLKNTTDVPLVEGTLSLPAMLEEHALSIGDGSQKPLYLLQFLLEHITSGAALTSRALAESLGHTFANTPFTPSDTSSSDDSSDSSLSDTSSSSESDSESSTDTDSDSESTSVSINDEAQSIAGSDHSSSSSSDSSSSASSSSDSSSSDSSASSIAPHDSQKQNGRKASFKPESASALIFASSTESATRLTRLISSLHPTMASSIANLTKSTSTSSTRRILSQFQSRKVRIIVATDRASRGLDLPGLNYVINYDVPRSLTSYVHRVGRTARAGNAGQAWTFIDDREAGWFWNAIARAEDIDRSGKKVARSRVDTGNGVAFGAATQKLYEDALESLKKDVRAAQ